MPSVEGAEPHGPRAVMIRNVGFRASFFGLKLCFLAVKPRGRKSRPPRSHPGLVCRTCLSFFNGVWRTLLKYMPICFSFTKRKWNSLKDHSVSKKSPSRLFFQVRLVRNVEVYADMFLIYKETMEFSERLQRCYNCPAGIRPPGQL